MDGQGCELHLVVLGSAAGGGSPQWNCGCSICRRVRRGDAGTRPRTQTALAVSADGLRWVVINAGPDLGRQIAENSQLHPKEGLRHSPIEAVVLTGGEVDQVAGLLTIRERQSFGLYASKSVHQTLDESPIFEVLQRDLVPRRPLLMGESMELANAAGEPLGVVVEPFALAGKIPLYREEPGEEPQLDVVSEDTVGLRVQCGDSYFYFIPCCAVVTPELRARLQGAPLVFFDGTLWRDDELIVAGLGEKTGRRMGHISIDGPQGAIAAFENVDVERKIFIHINNSNPILLDDTPQRRAVEDAGWEVSYDSMEIKF